MHRSKLCARLRGYPTLPLRQNYGNVGRDEVRELAMQDALDALIRAIDL